MPHSAGVLIFRRSARGGDLQVLLVKPGGPYWVRKTGSVWQIPKGGIGPDEEPAIAAVREVGEELGVSLSAPLLELGEIRQAGGKRVTAFAAEQDCDAAAIVSNHFQMEWPPRSGTMASFPEVSEARWMSLDEARGLMLPSQLPLLERLLRVTAG